jgi:hypothetical protein
VWKVIKERLPVLKPNSNKCLRRRKRDETILYGCDTASGYYGR